MGVYCLAMIELITGAAILAITALLAEEADQSGEIVIHASSPEGGFRDSMSWFQALWIDEVEPDQSGEVIIALIKQAWSGKGPPLRLYVRSDDSHAAEILVAPSSICAEIMVWTGRAEDVIPSDLSGTGFDETLEDQVKDLHSRWYGWLDSPRDSPPLAAGLIASTPGTPCPAPLGVRRDRITLPEDLSGAMAALSEADRGSRLQGARVEAVINKLIAAAQEAKAAGREAWDYDFDEAEAAERLLLLPLP